MKGKINSQFLDMMLDSGAMESCLAERCVTASPCLRNLTRFPYRGEELVDVNKNPVVAEYVIRASLVIGQPRISIVVEFVVVKNLPYSCIVGQNFLRKLDTWGVDNRRGILHMNNSTCPVFDSPQTNTSICLISQTKHVLLPGETVTIPTTPKGIGMEPFRPYSDFTILTEGDQNREKRTKILVMPSLNHVQHRNSTKVPVTVCNNSSQRASIGKGAKIAVASDDYKFPSGVCTINTMDPIDYLCSDEMLGHLSPDERDQARAVLEKHRSIFSMSNDCVGRTTVNQFDLPTENLYPVVDPPRRVPMHKEEIVRKILKKYETLGLIEKTDSPFRASTVLVEKKNVADSADVTDRYRLCVDYRSLNAKLEGSGWPTPSLEHCLDAAADAEFLSAIDFNSGYHQIPCTQRAKEALAFSPGFGFPQFT